jgi:hypothetical protein
VRFVIVLPPSSPLVPVWPRRTLLLALIWLAAIGVGSAVAYGLHTIKPILSSVHAANKLTSFPVLGMVSVAFPTAQKKRLRLHIWRISAATACLVVALGIALALNSSGARLSIGAIQSLVTI